MTSVVTVASNVVVVETSTTSATVRVSNDIAPQAGNAGKYLTTNGTSTSWAAVDALPAQTSHAGEFLTTDGTNASWTTIDLGTGTTPPTVTSWARSFGDAVANDYPGIRDYAFGPDGIVYICGETDDGTPTQDVAFVAALDADGAVIWSNEILQTGYSTRYYSIAVDLYGNVWAAGIRYDNTVTLHDDLLITRFSSDGTHQTSTVYYDDSGSNMSMESGLRITTTRDGDVYIVCHRWSGTSGGVHIVMVEQPGNVADSAFYVDASGTPADYYSVDPQIPHTHGTTGVTFAIKESTVGNVAVMRLPQWGVNRAQYALRLDGTDSIQIVTMCEDGSIVVASGTAAPFTYTKFDASGGNTLWTVEVDGVDGPSAISEDIDGNIIICGWYIDGSSQYAARVVVLNGATGAKVSEHSITIVDPGTWGTPAFYLRPRRPSDHAGYLSCIGNHNDDFYSFVRLPLDATTHTFTFDGADLTWGPTTVTTVTTSTTPPSKITTFTPATGSNPTDWSSWTPDSITFASGSVGATTTLVAIT